MPPLEVVLTVMVWAVPPVNVAPAVGAVMLIDGGTGAGIVSLYRTSRLSIHCVSRSPPVRAPIATLGLAMAVKPAIGNLSKYLTLLWITVTVAVPAAGSPSN